MLTWESIVDFATTLPDVEQTTWEGTPALSTKGRVFAHGRPELDVLVVACSQGEKDLLLISGDPAMFTTPLYHGYGAILINLEPYDYINDLEEILTEAWRIMRSAPRVHSPE